MKTTGPHFNSILIPTVAIIVLAAGVMQLTFSQTSALNIKDSTNKSLLYITETNSGRVGIGCDTPLTRLHIKDVGIALPAAAFLNEIVSIEDYDAGLGLYSDNGGTYGSVLTLGEIVSGVLTNKWSMFRTTNDTSELRFSFGANANYAANAKIMAIGPSGRLETGGSMANGTASTALGYYSTAGGNASTALGYYATASGIASTALGYYTTASGLRSTAIGSNVTTSGQGSMILGDASAGSISSDLDNRFVSRFAGGYGLYSSANLTTGVFLAAGGTSWAGASDSSKKENFKPVNGQEVLAKISNFRLTSWNFKGQDPKQFRHYGPTAQDFYCAFGNDGVGTVGDDTTIASADFDGINLIAIQALEKRTAELQRENSELKARLATLESAVKILSASHAVLSKSH